MPTRNVVLTDHQEHFIETLVESGRYQNASEVLRDGLRMVERREVSDAARHDGLIAAARLGIAALDRGDFKDFPDAAKLIDHLNVLAQRVHSDVEDK